MVLEMTDWHGGEMPVPNGTRVLVMHRDGELHIGIAGNVHQAAAVWTHDGDKGDIVAYREAPSNW